MKLNNKGFAITAVLYGLLILFVYFVSFYLLSLSAKKNTLDNVIKDIEDNMQVEKPEVTIDVTLAQVINNLYSTGSKEKIVNNSIEYNYAIDKSLMNDRLGGTTVDLNGGNIRYYGKSPNNYVYFNCSDNNNQIAETCELWRIIGVFDGKVKIIRSQSIGEYAWDSNGKNDWSEASLNSYLNGEYYNAMDTTTKNMIAEVTWNLGGYDPDNSTNIIYSGSNLFSNDAYIAENSGNDSVYEGNNPTWDGKIALMHNSDYGYATDFRNCSSNLYGYASSNCYNNDWLYIGGSGGIFDGIQWCLTHVTNSSSKVWVVLLSYGADNNSESSYYVRPTLYLKEDTLYIDGDGTYEEPYQIKNNN